MSVAATGWAFLQQIPAKPKIVLLALADQTDERTGRVCYGKTDIKYLAQKATVSERSLYRYLAALIRNGYAIRESGKEKGHESQYWLCLDRPVTPLEDWQWNIIPSDEDADDPEDDTQDVVGGLPSCQTPSDTDDRPDDARNGTPPLPIRGDARLSESRRDITPRVGQERPSSFSRKAQDVEREAVAIRKAATAQSAPVFVIYGTRAWDAWVEYRRRTGVKPATMATCNGTGENSSKRGWYQPTLFPPSASGTDPPDSLMTEEDHREMLKF